MDAKKRTGKSAKQAPALAKAETEAAERRQLIAEAAERRRAERLAEEAEADRRRTAGSEGRSGPRRAKGLYDDDEILPAAGSPIDDVLD